MKASSLRLSWRIGVSLYATDDIFKSFISFVKRHRAVIDEVALFETVTHHLYIPLKEFETRAALIGKRIRVLHKAGIPSVGVNVLTTIGHTDEARDFVRPLPFQPMAGHDGAVSTGCACPNTPAFREYVRRKYELVARTHPDFIWVDDDIRMANHGVQFGCFCKTCIGILEKTVGRRYTQAGLVAALNTPGGGELRRVWVEQNTATLTSLLRDIRETVAAVSPDIQTGLMRGATSNCYDGAEYGRWMEALNSKKYRPGGGFYSDARPIGMYDKAICIGKQVDAMPPQVTDIQYELESFPYQTLNKARAALVDECTLALAAGCNGIAFNALCIGDSDFKFREPLIREITNARPFWEILARNVEGTQASGLWPAWQSGMAARVNVRKGETWFERLSGKYNRGDPLALGPLGIPVAPIGPGTGTVFAGRDIETFSDKDIKQFFSGAVLMDSDALEALEKRGLEYLAGVRIARRFSNGVLERFSADAMNGGFRNSVRDVRIEFWHRGEGGATGLGDMLRPIAPRVRMLSALESYFGDRQGPCLSAFENSLGGRVIVMGYAPWLFLGSEAKKTQLQNAVDWITRDAMPVRMVETVPLIPLVRLCRDGRHGAVVLLNAGLDEIKQATVLFRTPQSPVRFIAPNVKPHAVRVKTEKTGWSVTLDNMPPWRVCALILG